MVANGGADALGHGGEVGHHLVEWPRREFRVAGQRLVQLRHVRGVVLVVVDAHRGGVDVWFQGVRRIGQGRQGGGGWFGQGTAGGADGGGTGKGKEGTAFHGGRARYEHHARPEAAIPPDRVAPRVIEHRLMFTQA